MATSYAAAAVLRPRLPFSPLLPCRRSVASIPSLLPLAPSFHLNGAWFLSSYYSLFTSYICGYDTWILCCLFFNVVLLKTYANLDLGFISFVDLMPILSSLFTVVSEIFVHESNLVAASPRCASLRVRASSSEETSVAADELVADLKGKVMQFLIWQSMASSLWFFLFLFWFCWLAVGSTWEQNYCNCIWRRCNSCPLAVCSCHWCNQLCTTG